MNLSDELAAQAREATSLLSSGYHPGALDDIADIMEKANDDCCGCSWPDELANILRGK
jgi:hypothetical protein